MALFKLGQLTATPAALAFLQEHNLEIYPLMQRHAKGDFGDLDEQDVKANVHAVQHDERIFSSYKIANDKIWIITEWDRSLTTILMPQDY